MYHYTVHIFDELVNDTHWISASRRLADFKDVAEITPLDDALGTLLAIDQQETKR